MIDMLSTNKYNGRKHMKSLLLILVVLFVNMNCQRTSSDSDEWVELFRPYVMNYDTHYGCGEGKCSTEECGSIIHGVGFEQIKLFRDDSDEWRRRVRRIENA